MCKIKIALVGDNDKFRKIILDFLRRDKDFEVVLEVENGLDVILRLKEFDSDILLQHIQMHAPNNFEWTNVIRTQYPNIKTVVLTQIDCEENIVGMLKMGAKGILGSHQLEKITHVLKIVNSGGCYYPDNVLKIIQGNLESRSAIPCPHYFTSEEMLIIGASSCGKSSTEISRMINKSHRTVEKYREALYKRIGVCTKEQMILLAKEWGII